MAASAEILIDKSVAMRGQRILRAMAACAPAGSQVWPDYTGGHRVLMVWGAGRPDRVELLDRHRKSGGVTVSWDLGYWDREHAARVSVQGLHPTAAQLALAPDGPGRREFTLREDADPQGPILLVGLGPKSARMLGQGIGWWEMKQLRRIKSRWPGRQVLWRPKGSVMYPLADTVPHWGRPIEDALRGVSLVVCRHSNVAVDACVAGVPVECEDGAALALYRGNSSPTPEQRADFLRRLTWFEWRCDEAAQAWQWIERLVEACD